VSRRIHTVAILLALALTAGVFAQSPTGPGLQVSNAAAALPDVGISNFGRVNANYYRGAQPKGDDYAELAALGIRTVIDLTKDGDPGEASLVQGAGMTFHRIPMTTRETPSAAKVAQFLKLVTDPANHPVYVHCQGGRHRTGVMTAVYRMTADGWTAEQAFAEMKRYKFGADFLHPEFKSFVFGYQAQPAQATAVGAKGGS
jgi:uncharacterized protein (TIGR01244 family)